MFGALALFATLATATAGPLAPPPSWDVVYVEPHNAFVVLPARKGRATLVIGCNSGKMGLSTDLEGEANASYRVRFGSQEPFSDLPVWPSNGGTYDLEVVDPGLAPMLRERTGDSLVIEATLRGEETSWRFDLDGVDDAFSTCGYNIHHPEPLPEHRGLELPRGGDPLVPSVVVEHDGETLLYRTAQVRRRGSIKYPPGAPREKWICRVVVLVDGDGRPARVDVVQCPPPLDGAVRAGLKRWRWDPATLEGEAIPSYFGMATAFVP